MITFQDCLALAELTEEEVRAIAEHEQLPEMVALELGSYLSRQPGGERRIEEIIIDDIMAAEQRGDRTRTAQLKHVLRHYLAEHAPRDPGA